jgi:hypothetical protein
VIRCLALLFLLAGQAEAGAWPRAEGETFLSFSVEADPAARVPDGYAALYAERGLAGGLTAGLDIGGDRAEMNKALFFLRWPLARDRPEAKIALEMGLGYAGDGLALRPGLAWGRGIEWGGMPGWLSLETHALLFDDLDGLWKADLTLGLKPRPRNKIMLQFQAALPSDSSPYVKLAPAWVRQIRDGRHIEIGVTAGIWRSDDLRLKLGLWHRF